MFVDIVIANIFCACLAKVPAASADVKQTATAEVHQPPQAASPHPLPRVKGNVLHAVCAF